MLTEMCIYIGVRKAEGVTRLKMEVEDLAACVCTWRPGG